MLFRAIGIIGLVGWRRGLAALGLAACLALAAFGCGGSGSPTTGTTTSTPPSSQPRGSSNGGSSGKAAKQQKNEGDSKGSGDGSGGKPVGKSFSSREPDPSEFKVPKGGDDSIQTFGSEAEGDEKEAVLAAMHSFLVALAESNYKKLCAGITSANRKQFELFVKANKEQGNCETLLPKVLVGGGSEARRAANGSIYQVRIEGGNAFILFTPERGKASYFTMKKEGDEWKSTSIAAGVPFNPITGK
jgi:hypothetical protein